MNKTRHVRKAIQKMASIRECPDTSEARTTRSRVKNCPTLDNYHCLKTVDGQLSELCTSPIWIEAGKCPIYSITGKLDARICQTEESRYCPTKVYKSNLNFNYQGCLPSLRSESSTININGKYRTTQSGNLTVSGGTEVSSNIVGLAVPLLLVLVIIVALGIAWWKKKKEVQKWSRDCARRICSTEHDAEAARTSKSRENVEKPKQSTPTNGTDYQEEQRLLNYNESAKEKTDNKKPKKGKSNASEKKPGFTSGSNGNNKNAEKPKEKISTNGVHHQEEQRSLNDDELAKEKTENKNPKKGKSNTSEKNPGSTPGSNGNNKNAEKQKQSIPTNGSHHQEEQRLLKEEKSAKGNSEKQKQNIPTNSSHHQEEQRLMDDDESAKGNQSSSTFNEGFIDKMADLVLEKDLLVLISSVANEGIGITRSIAFKACEKTKGTNIRMVQCFHDLRDLEKEKQTIVAFISETFKHEKTDEKSAVHDAFNIIKAAIKTKKTKIHALLSIPRKEYDDFIKTLKKSSLKYAVYDLSTMQEQRTERSWFYFWK